MDLSFTSLKSIFHFHHTYASDKPQKNYQTQILQTSVSCREEYTGVAATKSGILCAGASCEGSLQAGELAEACASCASLSSVAQARRAPGSLARNVSGSSRPRIVSCRQQESTHAISSSFFCNKDWCWL